MTNHISRQRPLLLLLILSLCLLVLGINGLVGGYLMLNDPNGAPMGMPVSQLERTPFQDFTIPGIILIVVWGLGSLVTLVGLWWPTKPHWMNQLVSGFHVAWAWVLCVVLGFALFIWLTVQVFTLPQMAPPQYVLYVFACLMIALPFVPTMRRYYRVL